MPSRAFTFRLTLALAVFVVGVGSLYSVFPGVELLTAQIAQAEEYHCINGAVNVWTPLATCLQECTDYVEENSPGATGVRVRFNWLAGTFCPCNCWWTPAPAPPPPPPAASSAAAASSSAAAASSSTPALGTVSQEVRGSLGSCYVWRSSNLLTSTEEADVTTEYASFGDPGCGVVSVLDGTDYHVIAPGGSRTVGRFTVSRAADRSTFSIRATAGPPTSITVRVLETTAHPAANAVPGATPRDFVFHYIAGPTVTAVNPPQGSVAGGTPVTVTGTNFLAGTTVTFGGVAIAAATLTNPTTLSFTTPPHAVGRVDVVVTNPGGSNSTLYNGFTYVAAAASSAPASSVGPASSSAAASSSVGPCVLRVGGVAKNDNDQIDIRIGGTDPQIIQQGGCERVYIGNNFDTAIRILDGETKSDTGAKISVRHNGATLTASYDLGAVANSTTKLFVYTNRRNGASPTLEISNYRVLNLRTLPRTLVPCTVAANGLTTTTVNRVQAVGDLAPRTVTLTPAGCNSPIFFVGSAPDDRITDDNPQVTDGGGITVRRVAGGIEILAMPGTAGRTAQIVIGGVTYRLLSVDANDPDIGGYCCSERGNACTGERNQARCFMAPPGDAWFEITENRAQGDVEDACNANCRDVRKCCIRDAGPADAAGNRTGLIGLLAHRTVLPAGQQNICTNPDGTPVAGRVVLNAADSERADAIAANNCVIVTPHWYCDPTRDATTFDDTGRPIPGKEQGVCRLPDRTRPELGRNEYDTEKESEMFCDARCGFYYCVFEPTAVNPFATACKNTTLPFRQNTWCESVSDERDDHIGELPGGGFLQMDDAGNDFVRLLPPYCPMLTPEFALRIMREVERRFPLVPQNMNPAQPPLAGGPRPPAGPGVGGPRPPAGPGLGLGGMRPPGAPVPIQPNAQNQAQLTAINTYIADQLWGRVVNTRMLGRPPQYTDGSFDSFAACDFACRPAYQFIPPTIAIPQWGGGGGGGGGFVPQLQMPPYWPGGMTPFNPPLNNNNPINGGSRPGNNGGSVGVTPRSSPNNIGSIGVLPRSSPNNIGAVPAGTLPRNTPVVPVGTPPTNVVRAGSLSSDRLVTQVLHSSQPGGSQPRPSSATPPPSSGARPSSATPPSSPRVSSGTPPSSPRVSSGTPPSSPRVSSGTPPSSPRVSSASSVRVSSTPPPSSPPRSGSSIPASSSRTSTPPSSSSRTSTPPPSSSSRTSTPPPSSGPSSKSVSSGVFKQCPNNQQCTVRFQTSRCEHLILDCPEGQTLECSGTCGFDSCSGQCCQCRGSSASSSRTSTVGSSSHTSTHPSSSSRTSTPPSSSSRTSTPPPSSSSRTSTPPPSSSSRTSTPPSSSSRTSTPPQSSSSRTSFPPQSSSFRPSSTPYSSSSRQSSSASFKNCPGGFQCTVRLDNIQCLRVTVDCPVGQSLKCQDTCGAGGCSGQCCQCIPGSSSSSRTSYPPQSSSSRTSYPPQSSSSRTSYPPQSSSSRTSYPPQSSLPRPSSSLSPICIQFPERCLPSSSSRTSGNSSRTSTPPGSSSRTSTPPGSSSRTSTPPQSSSSRTSVPSQSSLPRGSSLPGVSSSLRPECIQFPERCRASSTRTTGSSVSRASSVSSMSCPANSICTAILDTQANICKRVTIDCPVGSRLECAQTTCGSAGCSGQCCQCIPGSSSSSRTSTPLQSSSRTSVPLQSGSSRTSAPMQNSSSRTSVPPQSSLSRVSSSLRPECIEFPDLCASSSSSVPQPFCGPNSLCQRVVTENACGTVAIHCPSGTVLRCGASCGVSTCGAGCCNCELLDSPTPGGNGQTCTSPGQCASNRCQSSVCTGFDDGEPCTISAQCAGNFCYNGACSPTLGNDESCALDSQCRSNLCLSGTCTPCAIDGQCASNQCHNGVCALLQNGQTCTASQQCQSNQCENGLCTGFQNNESCSDGGQCQSGLCRGQICVPCNTESDCGDGKLCVERRCVSYPIMGNHIREPGEGCDDGNTVDGDGCSARGRLENSQQCQDDRECESGRCLNNICQPCDRNDQCASNACVDGKCTDLCGNGRVDPGEECDLGAGNSNILADTCRTDCRNPRCGDGIADRNEQCDDGNGVSGDGCDRLCRIEVQSVAIDLPWSELNAGAAGRIAQGRAPAGKTGPGAIAVMAAGGAAGWAWMRRKRKSP